MAFSRDDKVTISFVTPLDDTQKNLIRTNNQIAFEPVYLNSRHTTDNGEVTATMRIGPDSYVFVKHGQGTGVYLEKDVVLKPE